MPKVLCTLPNAAAEINGVKFSPAEGGMLSDEVSADQAEAFLSITGYVEYHEDADEIARQKAEAAAAAQREADAAAQRAAAARPAAKAPAKAAKPAKADPVAPVAPVEPAAVVEPDAPAVTGDDDTTF